MSEEVLDLSVPHLRLVSLTIAPPDTPGQGTRTLPGYFVVRGYLAPDGRMMITWDPNAALGRPSQHMPLPSTDNAAVNPVYGADTNHPMMLEDHGALLHQTDPRFAYLMWDVDEPNPSHAV